MSNPVDWLQIDAAIGIALTIVGGIVAFFSFIGRRVKQFENKWDLFMRDWQGEEPSPGRDAVPGVMERLNNIDGELKHNGGSTIKDAVAQIKQTQEKILERLDEGSEKFNIVEKRIDDLEKKDK